MDAARRQTVSDALDGATGPQALDRLVIVCIELLSVTSATVAVIGGGQHRGTIAVSDMVSLAIGELHFSLGEGPEIDANVALGPLLEPDLLLAGGRWPTFAPAAVAHGIRAIFVFPLRIGAVRMGVLSLYRDSAGDLSQIDLADAITIAAIATNLLLDVEADISPELVDKWLGEMVDHRAHVHQATGMIAAQLGCDVATALVRIRAYAWTRELSIDAVAADIVARRLRFEDP